MIKMTAFSKPVTLLFSARPAVESASTNSTQSGSLRFITATFVNMNAIFFVKSQKLVKSPVSSPCRPCLELGTTPTLDVESDKSCQQRCRVERVDSLLRSIEADVRKLAVLFDGKGPEEKAATDNTVSKVSSRPCL